MSELESAFSSGAVDGAGDVTAVQQPHATSKKRPPASDAEVYQRKIKRIRERLQLGSPVESNAVMILHEYDKDLKYELVEQVGPVHNPSFTVQLVVNGQVFTGMSTSKKKAKLQAAESAVQALLGEPPDVVASTPSGVQMKMETEVDEPSCRGMNPTVVLNQLRPGTAYTAVVPDDPAETVLSNGKPVHGMECVVDGEKFEGCGTNKKMSKALAADAALRKLFGIQCTQLPDGSPVYTGDLNSLAAVKQKFSAATRANTSRPTVAAPHLLVDLPGGKNPVSLLYELYSGTDLTFDDDLTSETPGVFVASIHIEDQDFRGQGTNKKAARTAAATAAVNHLHQSGLLAAKLTAKDIKRRQQTPWQPRQRPHFSQPGESTGTNWVPRGRGSRGRGRGRVVARNQAWVSGGVLKAGDFLGLRDNTPLDGSQFNADDEYAQLAETARNFAATSGNVHGYEMYTDFHGPMQTTSAQQSGQSYAQPGQKQGGNKAADSVFTAYGSYTTRSGASNVQTANQAPGRGSGRGFGVTRGGGVVPSAGKASVSAVGAPTTYRPRFDGSSNAAGYGVAGGMASQQLMQSASQPTTAEQYMTADSYTSVTGQQQQQQVYESYPVYDYGDASAAYSQTAYYTATGGQYLPTDTGVQQYYSQF